MEKKWLAKLNRATESSEGFIKKKIPKTMHTMFGKIKKNSTLAVSSKISLTAQASFTLKMDESFKEFGKMDTTSVCLELSS
jgi:hypothetical protein